MRSEYRGSERRTCKLAGTARSAYRYASCPERQVAEGALRKRLRELAAKAEADRGRGTPTVDSADATERTLIDGLCGQGAERWAGVPES